MDWFESSCVGWFLKSFFIGVVEQVKAFTVLGQKRGTDEELLPSETLPEFIVIWFLGD